MKRKTLLTLNALLMSVCLMVSGCQANESTNTASIQNEKIENVEAETPIAENTEPETTVANLTAEKQEAVPDPTPEPTPEPILYEGIDMESTLPGAEWIMTFKDIVTEPKFVVFNDETNKKVIVENKEKIVFEEGDTLAIFVPEGYSLRTAKGDNVEILHQWNAYYNEVKFKENSTISTEKITVKGIKGMISAKEDIEITCTITSEQD